MSTPGEARAERGGARFFDEDERGRGWAARVTRRSHRLTGLTLLDVSGAEPALLLFLAALDKRRLTVQHTDALGDLYTFVWASGYASGDGIRVQGVLEPLPTPPARDLDGQ